CMQDIQLLLTF
nr:immunoglobulin light chain junction region [Macaca mulatta]